MPKVEPFHTRIAEDFRHAPVWHDNDECSEGKKILPEDRVKWKEGYMCPVCMALDKEGK